MLCLLLQSSAGARSAEHVRIMLLFPDGVDSYFKPDQVLNSPFWDCALFTIRTQNMSEFMNSSSSPKKKFKLVLGGCGGAGKTALIDRFVTGEFPSKYCGRLLIYLLL